MNGERQAIEVPSDVDVLAPTEPPPKPEGKGFGRLTPEERAEISRRGGKAAHAAGLAHRWTPDAAREAGRKGGRARQAQRRRGATS